MKLIFETDGQTIILITPFRLSGTIAAMAELAEIIAPMRSTAVPGTVSLDIGADDEGAPAAAAAPAPVSPPLTPEEREAALLAGSGHDFGAPDDPEAVCGRCGVSYQHYADGIMRTCFGSVPRRGTVILAGASGGDWIADGNGGLVRAIDGDESAAVS